jgi:hypothetical protein
MAAHNLFKIPGSGASRDINSRICLSSSVGSGTLPSPSPYGKNSRPIRFVCDSSSAISLTSFLQHSLQFLVLIRGSDLLRQFSPTDLHFLFGDSEQNPVHELSPFFLETFLCADSRLAALSQTHALFIAPWSLLGHSAQHFPPASAAKPTMLPFPPFVVSRRGSLYLRGSADARLFNCGQSWQSDRAGNCPVLYSLA